MSITSAIDEFANAVALEGGKVVHVDLDERAYERLLAEIKPMMPVDMHEAGGDYDRPSSPWYGSRPGHFTALAVWTATGTVRIGKKR